MMQAAAKKSGREGQDQRRIHCAKNRDEDWAGNPARVTAQT